MRNSKKFKQVKSFKVGERKLNPVILHVSTPGSWRGGEQQLFYLMEELDQQNIEQYTLCNEKGQLYKRSFGKGYHLVPMRIRNGLDLNCAYEIKHLCKSLNITTIHTHDSRAHTLALLASVFYRNKVPVVVSRRVDFPIGSSWFSKFKYNHSSVAKIICVSKAIQEVMKPSIQSQAKLCTIHSGIDMKRFKAVKSNYLQNTFNIPSDYPIIGNISAIAPHKDYFTFVDTAEILISKGFKAKFFIIGDGPERRKIEQYVAEKGLEEAIYFTGFVKHIVPIMKSLDLLLITSKTEGLGTTILDAFACQVPVVATRAGGIPEIVQNGVTGLTAPIGDSKTLVNQVQLLFSDNDLKTKLVENASELLKEFLRETTAKKTLEVYMSLL